MRLAHSHSDDIADGSGVRERRSIGRLPRMLGVYAGLALACDLDLLLRARDAAERESEAVRVERG